MSKNIFLRLIDIYQFYISPVLKVYFNINCRYYPSCSEYAKEVINTHGIIYGSYLAMKRILRCNPLFPGGFDPPPASDPVNRRPFNHG